MILTEARVADYRAFRIGPDGHIASSRAFVCDTDEHAIEWAKQIQEVRPIEVWSGDRLVARLSVPVAPHRKPSLTKFMKAGWSPRKPDCHAISSAPASLDVP
jgi:hypothetical protein